MALYYYPNRPMLVPPDPLNALDPKPDYINSLEASGKYVAELKGNGDNCLLYTDTNTFMSRQDDLEISSYGRGSGRDQQAPKGLHCESGADA